MTVYILTSIRVHHPHFNLDTKCWNVDKTWQRTSHLKRNVLKYLNFFKRNIWGEILAQRFFLVAADLSGLTHNT